MSATASPTAALDFSPRNPSRVVDWRWRWSGHLVATGQRPSRRRHDVHVRRCMRFRRALAECGGNAADYHALEAAHPALYWAHELYAKREDGRHRMQTHAIEARILARQTDEEIATVSNIAAATVAAYHDCFFEVRPHCDNTDYLMFQVLGAAVYRGLNDRSYDLLWKLFAIWGGPHVLDTLISTFIKPIRPENADEVSRFIAETVRNTLGLKAMVAAKVVTIDNYTAPILLERYLQQLEIEKKGGEGAQPMILQNIAGMLENLPFGVAGKTGTQLGRPEIPADVRARVAVDGVELTGAQLMAIGAGMTIEAIDDRPLPPPPRTIEIEAR